MSDENETEAPEEPTGDTSNPEGEADSDETADTGESAEIPEYTFEDLAKMTVANLRDVVKTIPDHDALHGYSTMHKEELLHAMCTALGIDHHAHHDVVGIDKQGIKAEIKSLKVARAAALEANDSEELKKIRRKIRGLKRTIRKATV